MTARAGHGMDSDGTGSGTAAGLGGAPSRAPRLLATRNLCAGYFPTLAEAMRGEVRVRALVDATGHARESRVVSQRPLGQGFDRAALACVDRLQFRPAVDGRGAPVAGVATLDIRFARR